MATDRTFARVYPNWERMRIGLIERRAAVRVVNDLSSGQIENIKDHVDAGRIEFIRGDLEMNGLARKVVDDVSVVFHLAADHGRRGYVELHQSTCIRTSSRPIRARPCTSRKTWSAPLTMPTTCMAGRS